MDGEFIKEKWVKLSNLDKVIKKYLGHGNNEYPLTEVDVISFKKELGLNTESKD